jgi:hypothetical protein
VVGAKVMNRVAIERHQVVSRTTDWANSSLENENQLEVHSSHDCDEQIEIEKEKKGTVFQANVMTAKGQLCYLATTKMKQMKQVLATQD